MDFQVDPASCVLAFIALIFAWQVERRNTTVMLKLLECSAHSGWNVYENQQKMFHEFRVLIRNIGINIHNPTVYLSFNDAGDFGSNSIQLRQVTNLPSSNNEYIKGMIAEFSLKSYQLDSYTVERLVELTDFKKQKARLVIKSQDYIATELPLDGFADRFRSNWNRLAFHVNQRFERKHTEDAGQNRIELREILPKFQTQTAWSMKYFLKALRRELKSKSENE